jgi:hypothetical protein
LTVRRAGAETAPVIRRGGWRGVGWGLVCVAGVLVPVASAAAASGRIVPGTSIGPIAIGDERATIAAVHSDGIVARRTPSPAAPGNRNLDRVVVRYPSLSLVATFPTDEASSGVIRLVTRSPGYRTGGGIGVGSARAALLAAHPRAACSATICRLGRKRPGRVITRLHLAGRVVRVELLRVPRP